MKMKTARTLLLTLTALLGAAQADAAVASFGFGDIQNWTGTGANQAMLIIDWKNGAAPQSIAWGYRWDGAATGADMLLAIAGSGTLANADNGTSTTLHGSDPRLYLALQRKTYNFGTGPITSTFIYGMGYDVNNNQSAFRPGAGGATDSADLYVEGWGSTYWSYNLANLGSGGSVGGVTWASANVGFEDRILANNDADAWIPWDYANWMLTASPNTPVAAAAVPEPTCLIALLIGGAGLARRRRQNAKAMDI